MTPDWNSTVVICGPGRSGTTLLNQLLASQGDLAWISNINARIPQLPRLALLNRVTEIGWLQKRLYQTRGWPKSTEPYAYWDRFLPGFRADLEQPIDEEPVRRCREVLQTVMHAMNRDRLLVKITGAPRDAYLKALFENPYIVYIDRDPRAVVASYHKQRWRFKNKPEVFDAMAKTERLAIYVRDYMRHFRSKERLHRFRFHQVYYEDLTNDPNSFFRDLLPRLNLEFSDALKRSLGWWEIRSGTNHAWRRNLSPTGIDFLERELAEPLASLGYATDR